jgi:hypothetical protein
MLVEERVLAAVTVTVREVIQVVVDVLRLIIELQKLLRRLLLLLLLQLLRRVRRMEHIIRILRRDRNRLLRRRQARCSVRTVGLRILPCGDEMRMANQSVMHVV